MNNARIAGILGVIMSMVFVAGIVYLAFGERLGVKSAGPNVRLIGRLIMAPCMSPPIALASSRASTNQP